MNRRRTLTIAIIAQNEARALERLLPQLGWADEVLVVDGGSRDETASVVVRHGARLATRAFDNFANQRNATLDAARSDWVLFVDADETPAKGFEAEARRAMASDRRSAYRVPIRSRIFGRRFRFSGAQDDRPIRLVERKRARWTGDVHETACSPGPAGLLRSWLDHDTLPDLPTFLAKMNRYTALEAAARTAQGAEPRRGALWIGPLRETARRLIYKHGWLDGPTGWAFCLLSGLSEWVLARRHRATWAAASHGS